MKVLNIHHHLGLGDHIICNGLIRFLSLSNKILLFCKHNNLNNLKLMYKDNSNIELISVKDDIEAETIGILKENYIRIGIALTSNWPSNMQSSWDKVFYYQLNIPFEYSWSYFKYNKSSNQNSYPSCNYAFVCDRGSDNIIRVDYSKINCSKIVNSSHGNFFDNIDLIYNATEIHCINSAYMHLIDRLENLNKPKLYFHKNYIHREYSEYSVKKEWTII